MKTLVIFCPESTRHPHKTFNDTEIAGKKLRIIYHSENIGRLNLMLFKFSIRKLLKNAEILQNDFSENFSGNKIYKTGHKLALYHLNSIINLVAKNMPLTVFTCNPADIYTLSQIIMTHKKIKFLTGEAHISAFEDILSNEFGLSGGVSVGHCLSGEAAIIMPGGEIFSPEGAEKIINLSNTKISWNCINPQSILYSTPPPLKYAPAFLHRGDMLESVLSFLEMDYSYALPISLKINKHTRKNF